MENNRSKEKAARYALVYNKILQLIQEGLYPEGSKLPSEPSLAQQMQVSRSTLRQALNLLQEDGIIEARRGVGNFVRKSTELAASGLEKLDNPLIKSCIDEIIHKRMEVLPGFSTEYTQRIFQRKMPVVLAVHRYYETTEGVCAYCFSHIASDYEKLNTIDLQDEAQFLSFLEEGLYQFIRSRKCEIKVVAMTENLKERNIIQEHGLFQMIHEQLLDDTGNVIAVNKFYIPIEKAVIDVYSSH